MIRMNYLAEEEEVQDWSTRVRPCEEINEVRGYHRLARTWYAFDSEHAMFVTVKPASVCIARR
jgi:hypothetical protein